MKIFWPTILQMDFALDIITWQGMAQSMARMGHEVFLLVSGRDKENRLMGKSISIPVVRIKGLRLLTFFLFGYFWFNFYFVRMRPNVVICDIFSCFFTFPLAVSLRKRWKTKFIVDNRTFYFGSRDSLGERVNYFLTKLAFWYTRQFFDGMTAIVPFLGNQISDMFGYPEEKIGYWSSGVDIDHFSPSKAGKRPSWMEEKFVVMQHGSLSFNRGLLESVEAFSYISNPDIILLLVGKGIAEAQIKRKIKELDLGERVRILPPVPYEDVPSVIGQADLALLAYPDTDYWKGNNPLKLLEYMAMEKPIVCTDMLTFRDVIGDSEACFYIEDNSPEKIAKAIEECYRKRLSLDKARRRHRSIVIREYTWEEQARKLVNFIDRL